MEWIWLATWEDSREDVRWWPRLMKADGGLKATAAPVIIAAVEEVVERININTAIQQLSTLV